MTAEGIQQATSSPAAARPSDEAAPIVRRGFLAAGVFGAIFFIGGAMVPLDAAVMGEGKVVVVGNRQSVQHPDGGVVVDLRVRDGQMVEQGQVLIMLDATELRAEESVLARQTMAARMLEARLSAELAGQAAFARPNWMDGLDARDAEIAAGAYEAQKREFDAGREMNRAQKAVLAEQAAQLDATVRSTETELATTQERLRLTQEQLKDIKSLHERGYAPTSRVRSLEASIAELEGALASLTGQGERDRRAILEITGRTREIDANRDGVASEALREIQTELLVLEPKLGDIRAKIARTEIRAPVSGAVVGLSVFTRGGVVAPGQMLMEVVPEKAGLIVEAAINPRDAQQITIGQQAQVQFTVASARPMPRVFGTVIGVSADQLVDESSGLSFFKLQAELGPEEMSRVREALESRARIGPGTPASVIVPTRGRSALSYFLDPLDDAIQRGMRED